MPVAANVFMLVLNEIIYSSIVSIQDILRTQSDYQRHPREVPSTEVLDLLFGILFFMVLDYHPHWFSHAQHSLASDIFNLGGDEGFVIFYIVLIIVFSALMNIWFGKWDWGHIYYPPLYRKKEEARRKQREMEAQWRRQDE